VEVVESTNGTTQGKPGGFTKGGGKCIPKDPLNPVPTDRLKWDNKAFRLGTGGKKREPVGRIDPFMGGEKKSRDNKKEIPVFLNVFAIDFRGREPGVGGPEKTSSKKKKKHNIPGLKGKISRQPEK